MNYLFKALKKKYRYISFKVIRKVRPILWPNDILNFPFKMRRYPEMSQQFMAEKNLREKSNPKQKLSVDTYRELIVDNNSGQTVKEVVDHYNSSLIYSRFCPSTVTIKDMDYIIKNTDAFHRRTRQLDYLFIREFDEWRRELEHKERSKFRREEESKKLAEIREIGCFDDQNNLQYGFYRNTLFTRYFLKGLKRYSFNNLRTATLFGQKLVIDCSFDKEMQEYETQSVGRQMAIIYKINHMESRDPFDIHYCSCNPNSRVMKNFTKYLSPIKDFDKHYINIHSESYSQLFPNERLIYLSPDARNIMEEFDPKAIYILGSLVGKTCRLPLTKEKALNEGIECYRLPIHLYVELNPLVKKTLSFRSCFKILLEMKDHNNWEQAFLRGIQENKLKTNLMISDQ